MSGPVQTEDVADDAPAGEVSAGATLVEGRATTVGTTPVRRVLPRRPHRSVGPWCFADVLGPVDISSRHGVDIAPHPHIGLQTATWLVAGEIVHRDSLGSEQSIRPGQLNLMTAGRGIAHSEEHSDHYEGALLGIQLWIAQPEGTRNGPPAFDHHADLPRVELPGVVATVLAGTVAGVRSPARCDTEHAGAELALHAPARLPVVPHHEYAVVVLEGALETERVRVGQGSMAYLGAGRDEVELRPLGDARAMLLGGEPFGEPLLMWWNFVARNREEIDTARSLWLARDERFGRVDSVLPIVEPPNPLWG
ncbi:MAG TPA: pirin family protein [Acidimicrobiales bacterium]|nr:pirin family protein [Acidimicrobiales bacterium]